MSFFWRVVVIILGINIGALAVIIISTLIEKLIKIFADKWKSFLLFEVCCFLWAVVAAFIGILV